MRYSKGSNWEFPLFGRTFNKITLRSRFVCITHTGVHTQCRQQGLTDDSKAHVLLNWVLGHQLPAQLKQTTPSLLFWFVSLLLLSFFQSVAESPSFSSAGWGEAGTTRPSRQALPGFPPPAAPCPPRTPLRPYTFSPSCFPHPIPPSPGSPAHSTDPLPHRDAFPRRPARAPRGTG